MIEKPEIKHARYASSPPSEGRYAFEEETLAQACAPIARDGSQAEEVLRMLEIEMSGWNRHDLAASCL
jgi:hypothetical protein